MKTIYSIFGLVTLVLSGFIVYGADPITKEIVFIGLITLVCSGAFFMKYSSIQSSAKSTP